MSGKSFSVHPQPFKVFAKLNGNYLLVADIFKLHEYQKFSLWKSLALFGAAHGWWAKRPTLPKICLKCSTMLKIGTIISCLKKIQKI